MRAHALACKRAVWTNSLVQRYVILTQGTVVAIALDVNDEKTLIDLRRMDVDTWCERGLTRSMNWGWGCRCSSECHHGQRHACEGVSPLVATMGSNAAA